MSSAVRRGQREQCGEGYGPWASHRMPPARRPPHRRMRGKWANERINVAQELRPRYISDGQPHQRAARFYQLVSVSPTIVVADATTAPRHVSFGRSRFSLARSFFRLCAILFLFFLMHVYIWLCMWIMWLANKLTNAAARSFQRFQQFGMRSLPRDARTRHGMCPRFVYTFHISIYTNNAQARRTQE